MAFRQTLQDFVQVVAGSPDDQHNQKLLRDLRHKFESDHKWPDQSLYHCSPFPIFLSRQKVSELSDVCEALSTAITNIIGRWWSDTDARLWDSIPLDSKATSLLKWLDEPAQRAVMPYDRNLGCWRPDILLEEVITADGERTFRFKVCEINARYFCNGFIMGAHLDPILSQSSTDHLRSAYTPELFKTYRQIFNPEQTLYIIRGNVKGLDINMLPDYLSHHDVCKTRVITPQDLYLSPSRGASGISKLKVRNCRSFEGLPTCSEDEMDVIEQAVLEISQAELLDLSLDMLKSLALVCSNDMRTIFLAHDKRMLGVVLQELSTLVSDQHCLTPTQADLLRRCVVPTYLPGSIEMAASIDEFVAGRQSKDGWLMKPVGGGKGDGIVFGFNVKTEKEWLTKLQQNQERSMDDKENLETALCVLQPYIRQPQFDLVVAEGDANHHQLYCKSSMFLVGTAMMCSGKYIGTSVWRANTDPICAVLRGGNWFGAVTDA